MQIISAIGNRNLCLHADLHWILMFVDGVLGSHVIVGSPVEVELLQIVVGRQSTGRYTNQIIVVYYINLNCSQQITYARLLQ